MNFQVPQYIDVEDKIFGPLTFKQFIYVIGGAGACFVIYAYVRQLSVILALGLMVPVGGFFLGLAFYKINSQSAITVLEAAFKYAIGKKLYLWKRSQTKTAANVTLKTNQPAPLPKLSQSKLRDLSWSLDINENLKP